MRPYKTKPKKKLSKQNDNCKAATKNHKLASIALGFFPSFHFYFKNSLCTLKYVSFRFRTTTFRR